MDKLSKVIELLGADNVKRLQDGIVDIMLDVVKEEIDGRCEYILDIEGLLTSVYDEVKEDVKRRMIADYKTEVERRLKELLEKEK